MKVVCCGTDMNELEFLCKNSYCTIQEKRNDPIGIHFYFIDIILKKYLIWINSMFYKELVVITTPEIWVNRKKVSLTIKCNSCYLHFFEITYTDIKDIITSDFVI